jgi:hypothetical protein
VTWTAPISWATDDIITSSKLNTHLRDNSLAVWHPYDYSSADNDINTTAAETSLWSKTITGGDMGTNGVLVLRMEGDSLYNRNVADTLTIRLKFGGSAVVGDAYTFPSHALSASRYPWLMDIRVANRGATNSQLVTLNWRGGYGTPTVAGIGNLLTDFDDGFITNTAAVDTTSDQTLQVTVQWSASSANNSWRKRLATLHLGQN